jgi:UDP-2,3-diacylglucosamine pyrophosphatase LpxH
MLKKRLNKLLEKSETIPIDDNSKLVFFSDCHRGVGGGADDFAHNQLICIAALKHYLKEGFTYIELGDGDELWENKDFERIKATYRTIFQIFDEFQKDGRFYFIWGNHNRRWKSNRKFQKQFKSVIDPKTRNKKQILENVRSHESLVLVYKNDERKKILLVHGHQGELLNDTCWWIGRYFVRNVWKVLQVFVGIPDPTSPARNYHKQKKSDIKYQKWVKQSGIPIIIGHTHKSVFSPKDDISYFNDGSCVHPRCVTGIEIDRGEIKLIKWFFDLGNNNTLIINRKEFDSCSRSLGNIFGGLPTSTN